MTVEKIRPQLSYDEERKRFNGEILDGIVILDSEDGFGGRIIVTKDGKSWGFDKKFNHFVLVRCVGAKTSD